MEIKVNEVVIPERIEFNYEELKQELTEKVSFYTSLVYTDDQIKDAKVDRANLNKLKKALNDERIRREKEYMKPFNDFKLKIKEIIEIIDKPVGIIDKQVKSYEEKCKQEKYIEIQKIFETVGFQKFVTLDMIFENRWQNNSVSLKKIEEEMKQKMFGIGSDITTLSKLPEFGFEATEIYKRTLDINLALKEGQRLAEIQAAKAKRIEELEKQAKKEVTEEVIPTTPVENADKTNEQVKQWVRFSALISKDDALALKEFFNSRNIEFCQI